MYKIMLADDAGFMRKMIQNHLSGVGYTDFVEAADGAQAVELYKEHKPDLVLLDVMMPEMDGYETLRQIKKMPESEDLPVIFLTAKSDSSSEEEGLSLGAVDYITKPFSLLVSTFSGVS